MSNKNVRVVNFSDISDMRAARAELYANIRRGMKVACVQLEEFSSSDTTDGHKNYIGVLMSVGMNIGSAVKNLAQVMTRIALAEYVAKGGAMPTTPEASLELAKRLFPSGPLAPVEQPGVSRFNHERGPDSSAN